MKTLRLLDFKIQLLLLSLLHLATDGLCAYLVFSKLYPENPTVAVSIFLGYNLLAFVTQSPIGILIDKYNAPKLFLSVSAVFLFLGYALSGIALLSVAFIGLGNSTFHVAGGKHVTDKSGNDISHLGIFVSTGALGLFLGQRLSSFVPLVYIFFSIITVCTVLMIFADSDGNKTCDAEYKSASKSGAKIALLAVVGVVFIRSFVGKIVAGGFNMTEYVLLAIAIATSLGKAMGGICAKLFGINLTAALSMSVAAVCLTLGANNPIMFVIGVFAFNFSMPITLYFANVILKGNEGFAFGTLAAFLTPGYLLALSFSYSLLFKMITAMLCLLSITAIILISRGMKIKNVSSDNDNNS